MQIAFVKLAAQTRIVGKASEVVINGILVPINMLVSVGIYRNAREVALCLEGDFPLWDYDPSRKQREFGTSRAGAQDKFIFKAKHRSERLGVVNNVTRQASTFE